MEHCLGARRYCSPLGSTSRANARSSPEERERDGAEHAQWRVYRPPLPAKSHRRPRDSARCLNRLGGRGLERGGEGR